MPMTVMATIPQISSPPSAMARRQHKGPVRDINGRSRKFLPPTPRRDSGCGPTISFDRPHRSCPHCLGRPFRRKSDA
jgi:hypothetical protein